MATKDARVDAYIANANEFAKPILKQIRAAVHKGHPAVSETIKWGVPAYVDERGIFCMTAAFKHHCAWVFWAGRKPVRADANRFRKITSVEDLPSPRDLIAIVRTAAASATTSKKKAEKRAARPIAVPAYFRAALSKNIKARTAFDGFPPSHKREYVEWIASAKTDETRHRRLATALEWIASGKSRNWKYEPVRKVRKVRKVQSVR
jgi:uncharacterized protein YdeI (YjbR/CyaY-like superfamily)